MFGKISQITSIKMHHSSVANFEAGLSSEHMHCVLVKSTKDVSLSKRQTTPPPIRLHGLLHWFSNCGPRRHFHVNHGRYRIIAAFQNIFSTCVFYSFVSLIKKSFTLFKTNCFAKSVWCFLSMKLSPHTEVQCQFENGISV